jgi:bacterioferritin-associated ferredoxin
MIAAADVIAASIEDRLLSDLHALNNEHLGQIVDEQLGEFPYERVHCLQACFEAVHGAFADYRALQIEEFKGEKVLICTCFGVTEDVIEETLDNTPGLSVEKVGDLCNAGTGCGSCQMLIQEMIEDHERSAGAFDGV